MSSTDKLYWHFLSVDKRLRYGDQTTVEVGKRLMLPPKTKIIPCRVGYHASSRAIDALRYAPGPIVCRVRLHGRVIPHGPQHGPLPGTLPGTLPGPRKMIS